MRALPFFKPKKGIQFAGEGFTDSSGGGGGGSTSETVLTGVLNNTGEHTILNNVVSCDYILGMVTASYSGEGDYSFPYGYSHGNDVLNARIQGNTLRILFTSPGASNIKYKLIIGNLVTQ